ncbi:MAG: hypothetical protein ABFC42_10195 [Sulfuricella sp.]
MTAEIVSLSKWREDHPPVVRLVNIGMHCWLASWRLWAALMTSYGKR